MQRHVRYSEDEPRDDQGRWTDGGSSGDGGSEKPAGEKPSGDKKVSKVSDFSKEGIRLDHDTTINPAKAEKFLQRWNDRIKEAPEDFRNQFLGGLPGTMQLTYDDRADKLTVEGKLQEDGQNIGTYQRNLDLKNNNAYSAYFVLNKGERGAGVGKTLLKANVATYQKLGINKVSVSANIDVGGYAWAKYGYVPTPESWRSLSSTIRSKLDDSGSRASHTASGSGYTPESWEEIGDHDQSQIETAWMRSTYDEFYDSEVQNWRESGQALDDAKDDLAINFSGSGEDWAKAALTTWREERADEGKPDVPFTNQQILDATALDYKRDYEGRNDPDIAFDDKTLDQMAPAGHDPAQQTLPGIEPLKPSDLLSESARDEISAALTTAFNDQAEKQAEDADPPSHIGDSVSEYQSEYWSSMDDRDRYRWAERNGELPEYPIEDDEAEEPLEPVEATDAAQSALLKLASSSDPKALWAIADSAQGKQLLLGTSWGGVLDLKDKQSMDRFNAYVGK